MNFNFKKIICVLLTIIMLFSVCIIPSITVSAAKTNNYSNYIKYRGSDLSNTFTKLKNGESVNIVYFGGSVTNGHGASNAEKTSWRALVGKWFVDNFPSATVNNINASYGGTSSMFGAYRLKHDVLSQNPDLVFVEFAINDYYDSFMLHSLSKEDVALRYETIVRQIRTQFPDCDIVTVLTTDKSCIGVNRRGELHKHAQGHEDVSIAYNIPSIHVGRALSDQMPYSNYDSVWNQYMIDIVHPNDTGHNFYYGVIKEYLENSLDSCSGKVVNHSAPKQIYDYLLDGDIQFIDADAALLSKSNQLGGKDFKYNDGINLFRSFPGGVEATAGNNSVFALKFTGTELTMIQYSNDIESFLVTVDGKRTTVTYTGINPEILVTGLSYGEHTVAIQPIYENNANGGLFYIIGFFTRNENKRTAKYNHAKHTFGKYVSNNDASCKKDGTKTAKCTVAGCDKTDTVTDIGSKLAHKYKINVIKAATDTADGEGERVCSVCGRYDGKVVIPKGKTAEDVIKSESGKTDTKQDKTESSVQSDVTTGEVGSSADKKTNQAQKNGIPKVLIIVLVVVLVLLVAGIGVLVFILIKRKKESQ